MADVDDAETKTIWQSYDDGYVVRSMHPSDVKTVLRWWDSEDVKLSGSDFLIAMETNSSMDGSGFYIGEYEGEAVASLVVTLCSENVCTLSYYYVAEKYRGRGFGIRLHANVGLAHAGNRIVCIDAVLGKPADVYRRLGYKDAFETIRFGGIAKDMYKCGWNGKIVPTSEIPFSDIVAYDGKCFVSRDFPARHEFLRRWVVIEDGAAYAAVNEDGVVVGFGCRRSCFQDGCHSVGPLYADNSNVAEALLARLCMDVAGHEVYFMTYFRNQGMAMLMRKFGFDVSLRTMRMHLNGDPHEYKECVYAVTSHIVCF